VRRFSAASGELSKLQPALAGGTALMFDFFSSLFSRADKLFI